MQEHTFIYGIVDTSTDKIIYIGKSNNPDQRFKEHMRSKKFNKNKDILKIIILERIGLDNWKDCERKWINIGRKSGWPLKNCLRGGDGQTGCITKVENRDDLLSYLRSKQF